MSVEVVLESPLAHALNESIQPKLIEVGWSTGGADDSALSEYIILMLVNGKTQDQIAAELSGDLLNLGPDDPGAREFARWLFDQVEILNAQLSGGESGFPMSEDGTGGAQGEMGQDADMGDASGGDANVYVPVDLRPDQRLSQKLQLTYNRPTGPKSMRNGSITNRPRDRRMLGHLAKAMDRSSDAILHRVRGQAGNERINTHSRGAPTGPRPAGPGRGGPRMQNGMQNGRPNGMMGMPMQPGPGAQGIMNMSQQQQLDLYALLEQQSRMMAQMFTSQGGMMGTNGPMAPGFPPQQQQGRSLFERVQPNPQRQNGFQKRPHYNNKHEKQPSPNVEAPSSSMDIDMSQEAKQEKLDAMSPDTTCKYNLACTNKDCKFAHQSPAAPPGTAIDPNDHCSFGAACKNRKCVARHPSPAQKIAHQTELDCKFFPNCTNPRCPFRHPNMPLCRNGADCTTPGCKFTHVKTMCKFNPCLNPQCSFKHVEGQKRGKFDDKVWIAEGLKEKEHVSERKFVGDEGGKEDLIIPGAEDDRQDGSSGSGEGGGNAVEQANRAEELAT